MNGETYAPQSSASPTPLADFVQPVRRDPDYRGPACDSAFSERIWNEACERLSTAPALN
jgi:hypothetical protein